MKPLLQPLVVNDPFDDPVLYLDFLFEKRALLFDLGDIRALPARKILRISDIFVSHTHMDHFADFDWLLRLVLGREKRLRLFGPPGFIDHLKHKLGAYSWNLVHNYENNLDLIVTELHSEESGRQSIFRCHRAFAQEHQEDPHLPAGILVDEPNFRVRTKILDHGIPCLGFAVEESQHINIWKNRLQEMGLPVGPWLRDLKQAILTGQPNETPIRIWKQKNKEEHPKFLPLGLLKQRVLHITPGQKISYIVDIGYSESNLKKVVELIHDSHFLFIETTFLHQDAEMAAEKYHLTARQAGWIAREARVKQLIPINFSPRYSDQRQELIAEAQEAFAG
ncbi:ribonuclease Z [Nitrosococcus halophilus Nc 4]|uniref:Ribonuclease Z n=1 Tax=Nitrosococcus halophilus (strain Nc4) TaxID=472759 RepID=D5BZ26_NITHN|nr:MBL fold metallo-hydrolase [Nitrosococcus halophilus]ADE14239.1 ribonuclease Z [Nitrosococcus halophilus Nc 4]